MIRRNRGQMEMENASGDVGLVETDGGSDDRTSLFSRVTLMLTVIKRMGYFTMLLVVVICGLLAVHHSNPRQRPEQQALPNNSVDGQKSIKSDEFPNVEDWQKSIEPQQQKLQPLNTVVDGEKSMESKPPSCVHSLLDNGDAILANSSLTEKSISFRILLHPPTKDKYITQKILQKGTYEPEMEEFIASALPLGNATADGELRNHGKEGAKTVWAVDIGANVGFHSMHMASRGANTISFEPAPDTAALIRCSAAELLEGATTRGGGSIDVVEAGASDVGAEGKMSRHPSSPGMTTFVRGNTSFPLKELKNDDANNGTSTESSLSTGAIRLVRAEDALAERGVPEGRSDLLRLLKVDVEGLELRAFRGVNLTRFPFRFLTFEFFPKMIESGGDDPVDVLLLVRDAGYKCDYENAVAGTTRDKLIEWVGKIKSHVNIFCELGD